eukprot:scaffold23667_cov71-Cyclotella_meneghiniana.AAC.3
MPPTAVTRTYRTSIHSRERNRMHARKTRQRKKEHMQKLQNRADALKLEQIRLRQAVNEKNTASILVGLFQQQQAMCESNANDGGMCEEDGMDPRVEALLKRPVEDIPDASKIPELPALILPGQHSHKKANKGDDSTNNQDSSSYQKSSHHAAAPDAIMSEAEALDGIDYQLLGKDRSSCSPAELDKIRRERNRMHAKRTRDRKRIFMEEMEVMIRQLEEENAILQDHVDKMNGGGSGSGCDYHHLGASDVGVDSSTYESSPELGPVPCPLANPSVSESSVNYDEFYNQTSCQPLQHSNYESSSQPQHEASLQKQQQPSSSSNGDFLHQIESLLAAAGAFERRPVSEINAVSCAESDVTASTNHSDTSLCEDEEEEEGRGQCSKKQRLEDHVPSQVPSSITTTKLL